MAVDPATAADPEEVANLVARCILAFETGGNGAVEAVLADHPDRAGVAREQLTALRDAGLLVPPAPDPQTIGPYRILRRLGSGGVGTVYLAEQLEPVRRKVAIKVIRPGMDSREVLARFAVERHALALLDHPNVAHVLDAGTTTDGRPFLCMDFVPGQPITRYCDERGLDLDQRIELLARVCDAVQAAHQKGILHRDLKPSNILVSDRDGKPWPTVIDFGVAKSLGPRLLDVTLLTGHGRLVGTLEYMSPEQAANEIDVDTRTDVHALGVVLYELLSGCLPFPSERLRRADSGEFVRILREEQPPPPSVAARLRDDRDSRARQRSMTAVALGRALRGELDWIVQKAMEKDRNRRYGMAADLATDLRNHLRREPVNAGPPTSWYRGRKWIARHRLEAGSLAAVLLTLLIGLVTSLAFYSDALAKTSESEASLDVALEAVERMVQAGEDGLHVVPRMDEVRRELLAEALELHRRLAAVSGPRRVQLRTARALAGLAKVQAELGEVAQATVCADEARALIRRLPADELSTPAAIFLDSDLAFSYALWHQALGRPAAQAEALLDDAHAGVEQLLRLPAPPPEHRLLAAQVFMRRGDAIAGANAPRARELFDRASALLDPLVASPAQYSALLPRVLATLSRGAKFRLEVGDLEVAKEMADRLHAVVMAEFARDDDLLHRARLLPTIVETSSIWYRSEQFAKVVAELEPVVATRRELVRDFPAVPMHRESLGVTLINRALAEEWITRFDDAEAHTGEAIAIFEQLTAEHPQSHEYRERLLQGLLNLAHHATVRHRYNQKVDWTGAEQALAKGEEMTRAPTLTDNPTDRLRELQAELARVAGTMHSMRGDHRAAAAAQRLALDRYLDLQARQPDAIWTSSRVVDLRENLARSLMELADHEAAAPLVEAALELHRRLAPRSAGERRSGQKEREILELRARVEIARSRFDRVIDDIEEILALGPAGELDWVGHDRAAGIAFAAALQAPADSEWRARFAARCRSEIATALTNGGAHETTPSVMVAVMSSNSLRLLVRLERELGNLRAAAAAQTRVANGYAQAHAASPTARNRERAAAAHRELLELCRAAGDSDGANAAAREVERLSRD